MAMFGFAGENAQQEYEDGLYSIAGSVICEYTKKEYLELSLCKCHGKLKIIAKETDPYSKDESYLLKCLKCNGKYFAVPTNRAREIERYEMVKA